jgi:hypothetical protein
MNVHVSYKVAKAPEAEREFNHYTEKLQRRLQVFRPELVQLHAVVAPGPVREGASVSLNLSLPSGNIRLKRTGRPPWPRSRARFRSC